MNSPKGVKSCVPERVRISCPTCDAVTVTIYKNTGNRSYTTVGEHMWHRSITFVNKVSISPGFLWFDGEKSHTKANLVFSERWAFHLSHTKSSKLGKFRKYV